MILYRKMSLLNWVNVNQFLDKMHVHIIILVLLVPLTRFFWEQSIAEIRVIFDRAKFKLWFLVF